MDGSMQAEKILEAAKEYLIENFGNLVSAGDIYFNRKNNTWYVKIVVKTPKGIIPVSDVLFDSNGDIIEVPTKDTLLHILKTRLNEETERVILKVHAKDLMEIKRVVKDVQVL
jgi:hypothetical protein